jgi:hypothetical protein
VLRSYFFRARVTEASLGSLLDRAELAATSAASVTASPQVPPGVEQVSVLGVVGELALPQ